MYTETSSGFMVHIQYLAYELKYSASCIESHNIIVQWSMAMVHKGHSEVYVK